MKNPLEFGKRTVDVTVTLECGHEYAVTTDVFINKFREAYPCQKCC